LIQSIVANQVVQTAIQGQDPAIMLACSANNQAVLNIIESFKPQRAERFQDLQDRWLPDLEGYATYLPARNKTEKELVNINYMKLDDSGLFARLEEEAYVEKAERYFSTWSSAIHTSELMIFRKLIFGYKLRLKISKNH
jgi:hypothetical protein